jgi:hypothetical protein
MGYLTLEGGDDNEMDTGGDTRLQGATQTDCSIHGGNAWNQSELCIFAYEGAKQTQRNYPTLIRLPGLKDRFEVKHISFSIQGGLCSQDKRYISELNRMYV